MKARHSLFCSLLITLSLLPACSGDPDHPGASNTGGGSEEGEDSGAGVDPDDVDGDGWRRTEDCDDSDATVYPEATELCDGLDNDCDAEVDETLGGPWRWYIDADWDGFGDPSRPVTRCRNIEDPDPALSSNSNDCDDTDTWVYPGAPDETGDGIDSDCNGEDAPCEARPSQSLLDVQAYFDPEPLMNEAGHGIAGAGDTNGDGFDDVLVGVPALHPSDDSVPGRAYVVLGPITGGVPLEEADLIFEGYWASSRAGFSVAGPGDLDGDGFSDVLVGDHAYSESPDRVGAVYLLFGPASGYLRAEDADLQLLGDPEFENMGFEVEEAGDLTGDGASDLLMGAPGTSSTPGALFVVSGFLEAAGPEVRIRDVAAARIGAGGEALGVGQYVAGPGDLDGDGVGEVAFATYTTYDLYLVYVFHGPFAGETTAADADAVLWPEGPDDFLYRLDRGGDLDGDGLSDLVVGAVNHRAGVDTGAAYVVNHPAAGTMLLSDAHVKLIGMHHGDQFGDAVTGPGDLDGDGWDDLVVAAPLHDESGPNWGAAFVFSGPLSGVLPATCADATFLGGPQAGDNDYWTLSGTGDVDADGRADFLVGTPEAIIDGEDDGAAWLVLGGSW